MLFRPLNFALPVLAPEAVLRVRPLSIVPERYHFWLYFWPVTPILQFSRQVLIEGTLPSLRAHLFLLVMTAAIVTIGSLLFRVYSAKAMEQL